MKSIIQAVLLVAGLTFGVSAQSQMLDTSPNGMTALYKPGQSGPEVWVYTRDTASAEAAATHDLYRDVLDRLKEQGYVEIPQNGGFDYNAAGIDGRTRCDAAIAVYFSGMHASPNLDIKCGPANTYGNGLYVAKSINTMTARNIPIEVLTFAEHVENTYRRAKALVLFETAFAGR